MITVNCPGGWEGDCRPGGLFVVPYPTGLVETHLGTISAPDWLRFMRLASDGRVVGNAQKGGQVWEWADGRWHDRGPSFGNRPVIYTPAGDLDIVRGAGTFTGALGWRYVADDGRLIAAWETYDPSTPLAHELGVTNLWEWIQHGPFVVGQGADGGIFALDVRNGLRYQLGAGQSRLMAFALEGDQCAVAWVQEVASYFDNEPVPVGACVRWFTVAELLARPPVDPDTIPPPIDPDPDEDSMIAPVVTVNKWTLDELLNGREFIFEDTNNPNLGYKVRVHVSQGSMYAEIQNKAGHASTGQPRPVKPCEESGGGGSPEPEPEPEPHPPPSSSSAITTDHGTFWQVGRDGLVSHGEREDPFEFGQLDNGRITLKAPNGLYVCAEGGGEKDQLIANRETAGGWESFTKGPTGSGDKPQGFTLQVDNGRWVSAEADGRVTCNRETAGGWETFEAPDLSWATGSIAGRIRVESQRFINDAGWWSWRGVSDFDAVWHVLNGQESAVVHRFDAYGRGGRTIVRVLGMLSWAHRAFSPRSDGYWDALERVRQLANDRGLYVNLCFFADAQVIVPGAGEREQWLDQFGWFVGQHQGVIGQIANEPFKNGWHSATDPALLALADRLAGLLGHRDFSIGDPVDGDDVDASEETTAQLVRLSEYSRILVLHPSRKEGGDNRYRRWVDHLEGITDVMNRMHGATFVHDEPMGASTTAQPGRRDSDPDAHIAAQMVALCCEVGYTYHWITEECDVNALPGLYPAAELLALVPVEPAWEYKNDSWQGSPTQGYSAWGQEGKVRSLVSGGHAWTVGYGDLNWDAIHWASGWTPSEQYRGERVRIWKVTQ